MDKYYYNPNNFNTDGTAAIVVLVVLFVSIIVVTWWPSFVNAWKIVRDRNKVKSFVVKVKGFEMTERKFNCLTDDVNWILEGTKLSEVKGIRKRKLTPKNIISITDFPGEDCHYFVVWFRR